VAVTAAQGTVSDRYKWIALSNTTLGVLMAFINSSIVIISMPAIFRGIHLNPLEPGNVSYLLWLLMGYLLVAAVLVVTLGRLGDVYGRVRLYNAGFAVFAFASAGLALIPISGAGGALWLIGFRVIQGVGGALLMANSTAILTDAFPSRQRGMALGINMVAALAGSFIGLVAGGLLSEWDWRAVFWVSVPFAVAGTIWSYRSLRETSTRTHAKVDWWGNLSFGVGLVAVLAAVTYGIQPYGGHTMGWTNPWVLAGLIGGSVLLVAFVMIERRVAEPMVNLALFKIRAFTYGNVAGLLIAIARGGMQFMLIIWLQGIWLPLHGYDYVETPLWAGIYLLPLTVGFLVAGPVSGYLSDRYGARAFATGGLVLVAATFVGLILLPTNFNYWAFAALVALNGVGSGLFSSPNATAVMNAVPPEQRGAASGVRATFQNSGTVLSIGVCFSLLIIGLSSGLPHALQSGLTAQGVPAADASQIAGLPPVGSVFAAFLGFNPLQQLLGPHLLSSLPAANADTLTGRQFFPHLISEPFHHGLVVVFTLAAVMSVVGAVVSLARGGRYVHDELSEPSFDPAAEVPGVASVATLEAGADAPAAVSATSPPPRRTAPRTGGGPFEVEPATGGPP
jgi:MFS family permease